MNNVVLSVVEMNGVYSLELGNNTENEAFKDLQKNWGKLASFEVKKNQNVNSLSGFCRNYLQSALTLMNNGHIARQITNKTKSPKALKEEAENLKNAILIIFLGVEKDKDSKISRKSLEEKIFLFSSRKWKINDSVGENSFNLEYSKIEKAFEFLNKKIDLYKNSKFAEQSFIIESLEEIGKLQKKFQLAYNNIIKSKTL